MRLLANIVFFQIGWFTCVWQGGLLALIVAVVILALHFYFIVDRQSFAEEWQLITKVLLVGFVIETIAVNLGALVPLVENDALALSSWLPPLWLLCLWLLFATTLRHSLLWLRERLWLCILLAAVSAPSSYYGGALLSPYMSMGDSVIFSLVVIGVLWAITLPLIMRFFVKA